jgi:predicted ArsR family transcriptional regulator
MPESSSRWTFLTNHAQVLLCVAADSGIRVRDLADKVGITERAAQRILSELVEAGYVDKTRIGRRNVYEVHPERQMRHPLQTDHTVGELITMLEPLSSPASGEQ